MWLHYVSRNPPFIKALITLSYKCSTNCIYRKIFPILSLLYPLLVVNIGAVNLFTTYTKMPLLPLIIEQSTVPCLITIL